MPFDPTSDAMFDVDPSASVGVALRAAREASGRTVEQVSASTRIRATLIRDLEQDRFASSGGSVYARGHLRAIAAAIGVDPVPLVALYDAQVGRGDAASPPPVAPPAARHHPLPLSVPTGSVFGTLGVASTERRGPRWGVAVTGALGVLVAILAIGLATGPATPGPRSVQGLTGGGAPSAPAPAPRTAARPAAPVPTIDPGLTANLPLASGAQLRVRVIGGASWVSVRNATGTLFEGVLHDGEFKDFTDPARLRVVVGNASAVNLNCGGKDSGPAGSSGAVRRFACTASGLVPA